MIRHMVRNKKYYESQDSAIMDGSMDLKFPKTRTKEFDPVPASKR